MLSMADNYRLLHYLYSSKPDRQYPYWTPDPHTSDNPKPEDLTGTEIVLPTINDNYSGVDFIELIINPHDNELKVDDFTFSFSSLRNGSISLAEFKIDSDESIPKNKPFMLTFHIDENKSMYDISRRLTGIQSIKISISNEVEGLEFLDLVFKSVDYVYTLNNLENAYFDGESYVLKSLNSVQLTGDFFHSVPVDLERYVYMAGSAFAWLEHWEYESKPMKQNSIQSNNYADRLLAQVDSAIEHYLANFKQDDTELALGDDRLLKNRRVRWGL